MQHGTGPKTNGCDKRRGGRLDRPAGQEAGWFMPGSWHDRQSV